MAPPVVHPTSCCQQKRGGGNTSYIHAAAAAAAAVNTESEHGKLYQDQIRDNTLRPETAVGNIGGAAWRGADGGRGVGSERALGIR